MLSNHEPDELRVTTCLPLLIKVEAATKFTVPVTTGEPSGRTTFTEKSTGSFVVPADCAENDHCGGFINGKHL